MRWIRSLSLFIAMAVILLCAAPAAAAKNYTAERYDVIVRVAAGGDLTITETVRLRFEGGPFTYFFRELDRRNLDEIEIISVGMDGRELGRGTQPGQVEVSAGDPLEVTWHFSPTGDAAHEFQLVYQVRGGLRQDAAADSLDWLVFPDERDYAIENSTIRIEYPQGVAPLEPPVLEGAPASVEAGEQSAAFSLQNIDADTNVRLLANFPPGSLLAAAPAWQAERANREEQLSAVAPYGWAAAVLTALAGALGLAVAGRRFRRDALPASDSTQRFTTPPRPIAPAVAGRLVGSSTNYLGTLFDLARRGAVLIEEGPKQWGSRTFTLSRQANPGDLSAHDRIFLEVMFKKARDERVPLGNISHLAYNSAFPEALDRELEAAGWRDADRSRERDRWVLWGFLALAVAAVALILGLVIVFGGWSGLPPVLGAVLTGLGMAAGAVSLAGLIVAGMVSPLSDEGLRQAAHWHSFDRYLRDVAGGKEPAGSPAMFEQYLPYAAAFGRATEWAKHFSKDQDTPIPDWLTSIQTGMDDVSFLAVMAAITVADSSAASAGGGDGGASGGGASGGGASGAG